MADVRFERPTLERVSQIAADARQQDVDEFWAAAQVKPEEGLILCLEYSTHAWVFVVNDEPVCIFGVGPSQDYDGDGVPWMFASNSIYRHARAFLRASGPRVQQMRELYPHLVNYVDDRNKHAIRWLEWLGFEMGEPQPHGPLGLPFRRFEMRTGLRHLEGKNVNILAEA